MRGLAARTNNARLDRRPLAASICGYAILQTRGAAAMTFRIAVVQPITHRPGEDAANIPEAVRHIERAAADGAHFVCFPETYPGPWRMPAPFDPVAALAEAAVKQRVHVVFGTTEAISAHDATAYNLICMAYPDGRAPARYRRTHPNGP